MSQVDIGAVGCGNIACEITPPEDGRYAQVPPPQPPGPLPTSMRGVPVPPPGSFLLPKEDELDYWLDRSGGAPSFYDRDDSTKGNTNPKSHNNLATNPTSNNHYPSNSQRFSGNLNPTAKAPIIALPNKLHKSGYLGRSNRKTAGHIFPKKKPGHGKRAVPEDEPGSPKVSCFGKVLSERERERERYGSVQGSRPPGLAEERKRTGCLGLLKTFACCKAKGAVECVEDEPWVDDQPRSVRKVVGRGCFLDHAVVAEAAPGLGGMKRFSSGRRAASWGGDIELQGSLDEVADRSEPLAILKGRRSTGSLEDWDWGWRAGGPRSEQPLSGAP